MTRITIEAEDIVEGIESMQHIMVALQAFRHIPTTEKAGGGGKGPGGPGPGPGGEWFRAVHWLLSIMEDSARHLRNQIGQAAERELPA